MLKPSLKILTDSSDQISVKCIYLNWHLHCIYLICGINKMQFNEKCKNNLVQVSLIMQFCNLMLQRFEFGIF